MLIHPILSTIYLLACISLLNGVIVEDEAAIEFEILPDTDPVVLGELGCQNRYPSCARLAVPSIQKFKNIKYGDELLNWRYNSHCQCDLPPQKALSKIQFVHIPKTGTSLNWILHSYFDNCLVNLSNPCSSFLTNVSYHTSV